jgi:hypothetical protein
MPNWQTTFDFAARFIVSRLFKAFQGLSGTVGSRSAQFTPCRVYFHLNADQQEVDCEGTILVEYSRYV